MNAERTLMAIMLLSVLLSVMLIFTEQAAAAGTEGPDLSPLIGMRPLDGVPMGGMFANERINVYVDGGPVGGIVLSDGAITQAGLTVLDDPTMNIRASAETVASIATGQKSLGQCFLDGSITYEGVGFFNAMKAFFAGIGAWLYSLFS